MQNSLEFVHASLRPQALPGAIFRCLESPWTAKNTTLPQLGKWKTLPAFTWLDLGKVNDPQKYLGYWKTLASLQEKSDQPCHIFISGNAMTEESHSQILRDVFEQLDPLSVDVNFAGSPDVVAALAKFHAIRAATELIAVRNADLRVESGKLSARTIADLFGVTLTEVGDWIGRKKAALSKTPDSDNVQSLLKPLDQIAAYREVVGDNVSFRKWLRAQHELLEHRSPLDWIRDGRMQEVAEFVEDALTGQPT